jgi:glycosyltransferase involved in cell wall biosynthesis
MPIDSRPITTHVALVAGSFRPELCAQAAYTARLATELQARGIDVSAFTDKLSAVGADYPFRVRGVTSDWSFRETIHLVEAILRTKPDIVHLQHAAPSFGHRRAPLFLPLLLKVAGWRRPIVVTAHEYFPRGSKSQHPSQSVLCRTNALTEPSAWWNRGTQSLLNLCNAIIVTDSQQHASSKVALPQLSSRLHFVPIGPNVTPTSTDKSVDRIAIRRRFDLDTNEWLVVFFGFLHPRKGLETLFAAIRRLVKDNFPLKLVIVGGEESLALRGQEAEDYVRHLREQIGQFQIADQVVFAGYRPTGEVSQLMRSADLCVLPENSGVTSVSSSLMAALAHGLPTVATRAEKPDNQLIHGRNVFFVPPHDSRSLAEAISLVLSAPGLRQTLRDGASWLAESFSWERIVGEHLEIYEQLLARPLRHNVRDQKVRQRS